MMCKCADMLMGGCRAAVMPDFVVHSVNRHFFIENYCKWFAVWKFTNGR